MKAHMRLWRRGISLLLLLAITISSLPLVVNANAAYESTSSLAVAETKRMTAAEEGSERSELIAQAKGEIQKASEIDPGTYSEESYEAVTDAITKLRTLIDDETSTANEIREAVKVLDDAVKGLVLEADAKEQAIKDAKMAILMGMSWPTCARIIGLDAVFEAKEILEKILENPDSTSKEIKAGTKLLTDAISKVEVIPDLPPPRPPQPRIGDEFTADGQYYEVISLPEKENGEVVLVRAKNARNVAVPKMVTYKGKTFEVIAIGREAFCRNTKKVTIGSNVVQIEERAFKGSKVNTIILRTRDLSKKSVKGALRQSKVETIKVNVGSKRVNKKFVKMYTKIFTKKNAGRKVVVK